MMELFKLAQSRHEEIQKEAFAGLAAKAVNYGMKAIKGIGTKIVKNPGTAVGATLTGAGLAADTVAGANMAAKSKNVGTFIAGATHNATF
jgi:hypothetical protein